MKFLKYFIGLLFTGAAFFGLFLICSRFGSNAKAFYMDIPGKTAAGGIDFSKTSVDKLVANYVNNELGRDITVTAVGDMMFYEWQLDRAYDEETQTYDFSPAFGYISKYLSGGYVVGDIETSMAGANAGADTSFNGYGADRKAMNFNTPEALAGNLASAGFDMITLANEHASDSQKSGLVSTISRLTEAGIETAGIRDGEDAKGYVIREVDGLQIGFIAYTCVWPEEADASAMAMVNCLDAGDAAAVDAACAQIQQMRTEGAEAVVVMLHFGGEYARKPGGEEKKLARRLVESGADAVLGSHTHVPGLIEKVSFTDDDGNARRGVIVYSLGNFLTSQQHIENSDVDRDMGMICDLVFKKIRDTVYIGEIYITPVYSNWTDDNIAVVPVIEAHDNADAFGDIFDTYAVKRINAAYERIFPQLLDDSGLAYTIEENRYKISMGN